MLQLVLVFLHCYPTVLLFDEQVTLVLQFFCRATHALWWWRLQSNLPIDSSILIISAKLLALGYVTSNVRWYRVDFLINLTLLQDDLLWIHGFDGVWSFLEGLDVLVWWYLLNGLSMSLLGWLNHLRLVIHISLEMRHVDFEELLLARTFSQILWLRWWLWLLGDRGRLRGRTALPAHYQCVFVHHYRWVEVVLMTK